LSKHLPPLRGKLDLPRPQQRQLRQMEHHLQPDYSKRCCQASKIKRKAVDTPPQPLNNRAAARRPGPNPLLLTLKARRMSLELPALQLKGRAAAAKSGPDKTLSAPDRA